jgi:DNA polymerase
LEHRIWDGENWFRHDGVIFKGEREVITYEGLTATRDHLIWIEGEPKPVQLELPPPAAHISYKPEMVGIRFGWVEIISPEKRWNKTWNHCYVLTKCSGCGSVQWQNFGNLKRGKSNGCQSCSRKRQIPKWLEKRFDRCKANAAKTQAPLVTQLWRERDSLRFFKRNRSGPVPHREIWAAVKRAGVRQNQQRKGLRSWKPALCYACRETIRTNAARSFAMVSRILAVCSRGGVTKAIKRFSRDENHSGCGNCSIRKAKKLEDHQRTARLYDIRNAEHITVLPYQTN